MKLAIILFAALLATACAPTSYGRKPQPVASASDTYKFKIFISMVSSGDQADAAANAEISAFEKANGYSSHVIVNRQYDAPNAYDYFVKFSRSTKP